MKLAGPKDKGIVIDKALRYGATSRLRFEIGERDARGCYLILVWYWHIFSVYITYYLYIHSYYVSQEYELWFKHIGRSTLSKMYDCLCKHIDHIYTMCHMSFKLQPWWYLLSFPVDQATIGCHVPQGFNAPLNIFLFQVRPAELKRWISKILCQTAILQIDSQTLEGIDYWLALVALVQLPAHHTTWRITWIPQT